jgi:hypothetical protein
MRKAVNGVAPGDLRDDAVQEALRLMIMLLEQ